jgi:hypothetical protein
MSESSRSFMPITNGRKGPLADIRLVRQHGSSGGTWRTAIQLGTTPDC